MRHGFFAKRIWSPVEITYLQQNRDVLTRRQLSEDLAKSENAIRVKLQELDGTLPVETKRKIKQGTRQDLGVYMRSAWESNIARWLKYRGISWIYEPQVFFFDDIKQGTNSYCPDFYLPDLGIWLEVKGQMIQPARTAIKRFKKYHPQEFARLQAITGGPNTQASRFFTLSTINVPIMAYYNDINKTFKHVISHWE